LIIKKVLFGLLSVFLLVVTMHSALAVNIWGESVTNVSDNVFYYTFDTDCTDSFGNFDCSLKTGASIDDNSLLLNSSVSTSARAEIWNQGFDINSAWSFVFDNIDYGTSGRYMYLKEQDSMDVQANAGVMRVKIKNTSGTTTSYDGSNTLSTTGSWSYHITFNSVTGALVTYYNGTVDINTTALGGIYDTTDQTVQFPRQGQSGTGHLDNLAWYNTTLSSSQVNAYFSGAPAPPASPAGRNAVLNLTFDVDAVSDSSNYSHYLTSTGSASQTNVRVGNREGTLNVSATSGDYVNGTWNTSLTEMAVSRWLYYENQAGQTNSMADFDFYNSGTDRSSTQYSTYCFNPDWQTTGTDVTTSTSSAGCVSTGSWYHVFEQYNGSDYTIWLNGDDYSKSVSASGDLTVDLGENIFIGSRTGGGTNFEGYIDDFVVYDTGNFSTAEVEAIYQAGAKGTPVESDIFVKAIEYSFDYKNVSNLFYLNETGNLTINFTIENSGTNATGTFPYRVILNDASIYSGTTSLAGQSETTISFEWPKAYGFHNGYIEVDYNDNVTEDDETNNNQTLYIPFKDRPWITKPSCTSTISSSPSADSCSFYSTFLSEDFNPSWTADNVDPRGKKGYENGLGCAINSYNLSSTQCQRANNHLWGWLEIPYSDWVSADVQAIHQFGYVALLYDVMSPTLTADNRSYLAPRLQNITQALAYHSSTRPDLSPALEPVANCGNGWGFFALTYSASVLSLSTDPSNPMNIMNDPAAYQKASIHEYWNARAESYIQCYANDDNAQYPEGLLYKFYGGVPITLHSYILDTINISYSQNYDDEFNAMAREMMFLALDNNYNGDTLRNDEDQEWRGRSIGDSNSYEDWGSDTPVQFGFITLLGLNAPSQALKDSMRYLRDNTYSDEVRSVFETWTYEELYNDTTSQVTISPYSYDAQWENICIRDGWTFSTDSLFCIDGGDHYLSGHPNSQTFFKYAYGEPFIDYAQVPLEDDVRGEQWHNGLSFVSYNDTVGSQYVEGCSDAANNEYIGDNDCTNIGSYPSFRRVPENYTGNITQVYISADGLFSVWKEITPMKNSEDIIEDWIKINNTEIRRVVVAGNAEGRIVDGITNIYDEFNASINGYNVTFNRDGTPYYVEVGLVMNNDTVSEFYSVDTGKNISFTKTGSADGNVSYRRTEMVFNDEDIDFIKTYAQYNTTKDYTLYYDGSKVYYNGVHVYYDTNNDGLITGDSYTTDADILAVNINGSGTFMVSGATYVVYDGDTLYNSTRSSFIGNNTVAPSNTSTVTLTTYELASNNTLSNITYYYALTNANNSVYDLTTYATNTAGTWPHFSASLNNAFDESLSSYAQATDTNPDYGDNSIGKYFNNTYVSNVTINTSLNVDPTTGNTAIGTISLFYVDDAANTVEVTNTSCTGSSGSDCTTTLIGTYNINSVVERIYVKYSGSLTSYDDATLTLYDFKAYRFENVTSNPIELPVNNYTFFAEKQDYYDLSSSFILTGGSYAANLYGMYNSSLNVSIYEAIGGGLASGTNFISVESLDYSYNATVNTSSGSVNIPLIEGDYAFTITGANYATLTVNHTVSGYTDALNISAFSFNSILITIYNDTTTDLLDQAVTVETFSNVTSYVNTTFNGTLELSLLEPDTYQLRFNSSGYYDQTTFLTVTNESTQNLQIYMIPNTTDDIVRVQVLSLEGAEVSGARVKLQKQVVNGASTLYYTVDEKQTNSEGYTAFYVTKSLTDYYRFIVSYEGDVKLTSVETFFVPNVEEVITLTINTGTSTGVDIDQSSVTTSLVASGSDNETYTFSWADADNEITGGRLIVKVQNLNYTQFSAETLYDSGVTNGFTGSLQYSLPVVNNTKYIIEGQIVYRSFSTVFESTEVIFGETVRLERNTGLLLASIVFIIVVLLSLSFGALASGLLGLIAIAGLAIVGLVNIPIAVITSLMAFLFIISIKTKGGGQ